MRRSRAVGAASAGILSGAVAVVALTGCGGSEQAAGAATAPATTAPASTAPATTAPATTAPVTTAAPTMAGPTTSSAGTCANAHAALSLLAALASADGRAGATELPGHTFVGSCGATSYAVATMVPAPLASTSEAAALEEQPAPDFLERAPGGSWSVVGHAPPLPTVPSCSTFTLAPAALRSIWGDCTVAPHSLVGTQGPGDQTRCEQITGAETLVRILAVSGDTITAEPVGVHCGGPDDVQYPLQPGREQLTLAPGAAIARLGPSEVDDQPVPLDQLSAVSDSEGIDLWEVYGLPPGQVTGLSQVFHP